MTEILNLTGHPLVLKRRAGAAEVRIKSHGRVRVEANYIEDEMIEVGNGIRIPILLTSNGDTFSLPAPEDGRLIVVSGLVAGRVRRRDVLAPARLAREGGQVEFARALMRYGERH